MSEPIIHSHVEDVLPNDHRLAFECVYCQANKRHKHKCNELLHCANNECMTTWVEWNDINVCMEAFILYFQEVAESVLDFDEFRKFIK